MSVHRRFSLGLVGIGALVAAVTAAPGSQAEPSTSAPHSAHPARASLRMPTREEWYRLVERERKGALYTDAITRIATSQRGPRGPQPPPQRAGIDVLHRTMDVDVDPRSGAVTATIDLKITAIGRPIASLGVALGKGITLTSVDADAAPATFSERTSEGFLYNAIQLPSPVTVGREVVVRVRAQGTLDCSGGNAPCTLQPGFARFTTGSIIPYVFDLENAARAFDGATTDLTLRVPEGLDTVVSAERGTKRVEGGKSVTTWNVPKDVNHSYGFYAFVGDLNRQTIAGRSVPTELVSPRDGSKADAQIASWSNGALSFVEGMMGQKLPFGSQNLVRLPLSMDDVGTVSYGMTLLNETYGRAGDDIYHETWVHENAHLAWAIVVPEPEGARTRMFTEGLATLTEIDFSKSLFPDEDRDAYLARRFQSIRLDWLGKGSLEKLPPVVATEAAAQKLTASGTAGYSGWAYEKSASTLDHVRAIVGDEAFAAALKEYVRLYQWKGASVDELREVLEKASGVDLKPVFARWLTATSRPELRFVYGKNAAGALTVTIEKDDEDPIPVAVTVIDMNGEKKTMRVLAEGTSTLVQADSAAGLYAVVPNPRQGILEKLVSTTKGDVDFDGEADGKDLLACGREVGTKFSTSAAANPGLWNIESRFAVQCDIDEDGDVDEDDWETIKTAFGGKP